MGLRAVAPAVSTAVASPAPVRPAHGGFSYPGVALPDLSAARAWVPGLKGGLRGAEANRSINEAYAQLDGHMTRYLGEPLVPNWMSFGKYASREAGGQLLRLEEALDAFQGGQLDGLIDSLQNAAKHPFVSTEDSFKLLLASHINPLHAIKAARVLHDGLVHGNVGVYADIAPAYEAFLKGEAQGGLGLEALKAAGYGQGERDPQGFLMEAFRCYRQAKHTSTASPEGAAQRRALIERGTLLMGVHEQMVVLQGPKVFGHPEMAKVLGRMGKGAERLHEPSAPGGVRTLLPHGGNWADYATRMGFEAVPSGQERPSDVVVRDHFGVSTRYRITQDPARLEGTIAELFIQGAEPAAARLLVEGQPRPLPKEFLDGNDLGRAWAKLQSWVRGLFGR